MTTEDFTVTTDQPGDYFLSNRSRIKFSAGVSRELLEDGPAFGGYVQERLLPRIDQQLKESGFEVDTDGPYAYELALIVRVRLAQ